MEVKETELSSMSKGRGICISQRRPRKPWDQLIDEGVVPSEEKIQQIPLPSGDNANDAEQIVRNMEALTVSTSTVTLEHEIPMGTEPLCTGEMEDNNSSTSARLAGQRSSYEIFLQALDKPDFVPRYQYQAVSSYTEEDFTTLQQYNDRIPENDLDEYNDHKSWEEYLPGVEDSATGISINPDFLGSVGAFDSDQQTVVIFQNLVEEISLSPFDEDLYGFAACLVAQWAVEKETVQSIAKIIIEQGVQDPCFSYPAGKLAFLLSEIRPEDTISGTMFQKEFFSIAKKYYDKAVTSFRENPSEEAIKQIMGVAIFFGELLNSMEVKGKLFTALRRAVIDLAYLFMKEKNEELIACLIKLLKLTGPLLDANKEDSGDSPVDQLFESVRDFWLSSDSSSLPGKLKEGLIRIYKLHTRDWDRSPEVSSSDRRDDVASVSGALGSGANEESFGGSAESRIMHDYQAEDEEIDAAFEEFLVMSGQV